MQHGESERPVGARVELQVHVCRRRRLMANRIDDDLGRGRLGEPILVDMRRRGRRIGAPDHHAVRTADGARIEAAGRFSVHQLQRHVACLVAHRIRVDLGRADAVEEPQGKGPGDQGAGSGVMRLQDRLTAIIVADGVEAVGDVAERLVPVGRLETAGALGPNPLQGTGQAHGWIAPHAVIANGTFAAQRAAADIVVRIADHVDGAVRRNLHQHATRVVAIARAGGADRGGALHRLVSSANVQSEEGSTNLNSPARPKWASSGCTSRIVIHRDRAGAASCGKLAWLVPTGARSCGGG